LRARTTGFPLRGAKRSAMFIVVEGIEASGKSTLVRGLVAALIAQGTDAIATREPGGTPLGDRMRATFLEPGLAVDPVAEAFVVSASRAQLVATVVEPALDAGRTVVCDRYTLATEAYQGFGRGVDRDVLRTLAEIATRGLRPDVVLLVDVPIAVSADRVRARTAAGGSDVDRLEREDAAFHERVRAGYLRLAGELAFVRVLDGTRTPPDLLHDALAALAPANV